jgi:ribonuclease T2
VAETARREGRCQWLWWGIAGYIRGSCDSIKGFRALRRLIALALTLLLAISFGPARSGAFDYYILALSWNPSWCALSGDARDAPTCAAGAGLGFTLHGLWPQHEAGWPEHCATAARDPSRQETAAMADIMGSGGLAWHQWVKHGRCAGLAPDAYFAAARAAFEAVALPDQPAGDLDTTPAALIARVRALNPDLPEDGAIVTCRDGLAAELRLCLTRALEPRPCAPDVLARACTAGRRVVLPAPR